MAALSYTQDFDGLSTADLNGQDSWAVTITGTATCTVQTGVVIQGTKTLKFDIANNADADARRSLTSCDSGDFFFSFQIADLAGNKRLIFGPDPFTANVVAVGIPGASGGSFWGDTVSLIGPGGNTTVDSTFSTLTTYYVNVQFDDVGQNDKTRARVWKPGSGWGAFTSWVSTDAYTAIGKMRIDCAGGDGTGATVCYFDTFQETDPAPASTSIKTWDGLAYASMKTLDGLATASIKTINGLQ